MKRIFCYRRGCSNRALWVIPGKYPLYLCTKHMRELWLDGGAKPEKIQVGPSEFKEMKDD